MQIGQHTVFFGRHGWRRNSRSGCLGGGNGRLPERASGVGAGAGSRLRGWRGEPVAATKCAINCLRVHPKCSRRYTMYLLDLVGEMRDGLKSLRLDAADVRDAFRVLEEMKSFVAEPAAHFVGRLQREFAFLLPREPHRFQQRGILKLAAGRRR